VHPIINVEAGQFVVYYTDTSKDSSSGKGGDVRGIYYKAAVSRDGLTSREKVEVSPESVARRWHAARDNPFETVPRGGAALPLGWDKQASVIGGFCQKDATLTFHMSASRIGYGNFPMYLGAYSIPEKRLRASIQVGNPGRIYSFPVASQTVLRDEHVYVAWIEERDRKKEMVEGGNGAPVEVTSSKTQMVISRWRIGDDYVLHWPIRQTIGDNSSIDLEIHKNQALVAWHEGIGHFNSRIGTALLNLNETEFSPELPLSPVESFQQSYLNELVRKSEETVPKPQ
jgi:hypothetical protein